MSTLSQAKVSLALLVLLSTAILSGHAQCKQEDTRYTICDHTTPVCKCKPTANKECYYCFEIEQRHTFTKYVLTGEDIQIPGYGGRVWYFDDDGQL